MTTRERIQNELQLLGITKRYRGYTQVLLAIELEMENEECLQNVTEQVYKVVAGRCSCDPSCVERNIRTVSHVAWKANRARLRTIAGYPLYAFPAAAEFISLMTAYLQRLREPRQGGA